MKYCYNLFFVFVSVVCVLFVVVLMFDFLARSSSYIMKCGFDVDDLCVFVFIFVLCVVSGEIFCIFICVLMFVIDVFVCDVSGKIFVGRLDL